MSPPYCSPGALTCHRSRLLTLLVALALALMLCSHNHSPITLALADPVAHANPEALVVPKGPKAKRSEGSDNTRHHGDSAGTANKPGRAGDDDDLNVDTGDDISELGDPMTPVTTEVDGTTRTRTTDSELITDVVADGDGDAAIVLDAAALFDDPASDVVEILAHPPPTVPEPVPVPRAVRRDGRQDIAAEFTQAVEIDQIVPVTTDAGSDAPASPAPDASPVPAPAPPGQVVSGRPTSSTTATRPATRPPPAGSTGSSSTRPTATSRPGSGGSGGDSNPDSHSGDQTLEILITDNSAVGTGPNGGSGKGANVDFAVNGFGVSVSGSLKRGNKQPVRDEQ